MPKNDIKDLLDWIVNLNNTTKVVIEKNKLSDSDFWYYDKERGQIVNRNNSFFQITGFQKELNGEIITEQPIIIQDEIGYIGLISREFDGELHYLMQAKIEPGNLNKIQISPTVQATKSNFEQKHGGRKPAYLDYFINASKYKIIVDQVQSEQSSRFYKKRNRNIIIQIYEDIEELPNYKWITFQQIKELMRIDNLVNMDTRTAFSCLPLVNMQFDDSIMLRCSKNIKDESFFKSIMGERDRNTITEIYHYINNYKMFDESVCRFVPLHSLENWTMTDEEIVCNNPYNFKVVFCDIEIEDREVRRWTQPLFEAMGIATFGLFTCVDNGIRKFLVRALPEVGCFDKIELSPSVQREYINLKDNTVVDDYFDYCIKENKGIKFDVLLSEEGGRFYCEQNRNVIIEIDKSELDILPDGYFWTDFRTLNTLTQVNNCLNIQLRNLLSVLEW